MNFFSILKSVEEFIYQLALWVILLPITIFVVLTRPLRMPAYVRRELAKDEKKEFGDLVSPILFWILLVIAPAFFLIRQFYILPAAATTNPVNYLYYICTCFVAFLLTPALLIHIFEKKKIDREGFKRTFFLQCYLQSPIFFFIIMFSGLFKYLGYDFNAMNGPEYMPFVNSVNGWKDILIIILVGLVFYLAYMEYAVMRKMGIKKPILIIFLCVPVSLIFMLATTGIGLLFYFGVK